MKTLTPAQLRAARALIRWSATDLAKAAKVGVATVRRAEAADSEKDSDVDDTKTRKSGITAANEAALIAALEGEGVEFIAENGGGPGVRLKRSNADGA